MESYMEMLANHAKHAAVAAAKLGTAEKNKGLCAVADELIMQQELILAENQKDLKAAEEKGVKQSLIDRLALSEKDLQIWRKDSGRLPLLTIRSEKYYR